MLFNRGIVLAIVSALSTYVNAQQEAIAPEDSSVVKLSADNFESFIKEHTLVLAEFFAPWCGHCKNLAPEYVLAAADLEPKNISLAQIDCTENQDLCVEQGIRGYPTLKVFKNGNIQYPVDYQGQRNREGIVSYMIKQLEPPVKSFTGKEAKEDFEAFVSEASTAVIVDYGVEGLNDTFYELAGVFNNDFSFVQYMDSGISKPDLKLYLLNEDPIVFNEESYSVDTLAHWIKVEAKPYFGEIDGMSFESYMEANIPLAYFFYNSPEEREEYETFFKKLGKEYRGKINFAGLDASKYGRHADNLNMKEQFPLFSIHDISNNLKYGLPQLPSEEFEALSEPLKLDHDDILEFVEKFYNGELDPIIKSEEIPEVQESTVYKLVAKSHDEIARDPTKDVLVKYYAPWCGHCKRLVPIYEDLADIYASDDDAKDKVIIAEIDATLNDVSGVTIEGFPTIILYPAGKDTEPVLFEASRTTESFLEFIKLNGGHGIDGLAISKDEEEEEDVSGELEDSEDVNHDEL